jgi:cytochrome c-type biogenesis protein CcmF
VAPALPWRKTSLEVMRGRLAVPAAFGVVVVVACVLGGIHGIEPLLAFGLGAFAAGSAVRALALSVRGAYRGTRSGGASPARSAAAGWRGFVGRANGGMVVHIGVVVIAIGLAAATSFLHRGELHLSKGQSATFAGHSIAFVGTRQVTSPSHSAFEAVLRVDSGGTFTPAISQFGSGTQAVGTPAIDSSWRNDLYLTIDSIPSTGTAWTFGVVEQPLVMWLWIGALLVGFGSLLSAIPGRRRRPTDPVSAPVVARTTPIHDGPGGADGGNDPRPEAETDPLPVGAGDQG